ncbi:MAG: DNA-directed RNA polymerase subunit L [Candidatus Undinarchaeales archaeon]|jgi:DNA-directed RNA polymerase subunit L|nr:DNA-directed RNA polymerase subunit L [Candidatus Undinarchaeales archaeon]
MELKILKDEKDLLEVELVGETHTLTNVLKDICNEDKSIDSASYRVDHPMTSNPILVIRTKTGSPKTAVKKAAAALEKIAADFGSKFKKSI